MSYIKRSDLIADLLGCYRIARTNIEAMEDCDDKPIALKWIDGKIAAAEAELQFLETLKPKPNGAGA